MNDYFKAVSYDKTCLEHCKYDTFKIVNNLNGQPN